MQKMKYTGDEVLSDVKNILYGEFKPDNDGLYLEVPHTTYSDYSGCTIERANCDEFMSQFGNLPGVWELYGGFGTRGIVISLALYESNEEIKGVIDGLEDYPLINDEALCELETKIEGESWDSWVKDDLKRALDKASIEYPDDDDQLHDLFNAAAECANEYPIFEDAVSCFWHIDRIIEHWTK